MNIRFMVKRMPISRVVVGKGRSRPIDPRDPGSEWEKTWYQVEAEIGPGEVAERVKDELEHMIGEWLEAPSKEVEAIPTLDLEALPWQKRDKKPCAPGEWGWIFGPKSVVGPPEGAEPLIMLLDKEGGKVELPPYEVTYSKDKAFIQRRPIKSSNSSEPHAKMDKALRNIKTAGKNLTESM